MVGHSRSGRLAGQSGQRRFGKQRQQRHAILTFLQMRLDLSVPIRIGPATDEREKVGRNRMSTCHHWSVIPFESIRASNEDICAKLEFFHCFKKS